MSNANKAYQQWKKTFQRHQWRREEKVDRMNYHHGCEVSHTAAGCMISALFLVHWDVRGRWEANKEASTQRTKLGEDYMEVTSDAGVIDHQRPSLAGHNAGRQDKCRRCFTASVQSEYSHEEADQEYFYWIKRRPSRTR